MKVYRGAASAARTYVEADRSRADDYYLADGTGLATRYVATPDTVGVAGVLDGPAYERWVAGYDVETGEPKGRLRADEHGVRFTEVVVNGPKTWSLAAALHPDVATAYDAAQDRAAEQIIGWLASHATTRVGPRGRQVQVPVEQLEAAVVRHYTSRAGDPHRHLHLQVNARVFAQGRWRGLHTVGVRDSLEAINGIGHAAVLTDPGFRATLAGHGLDVDPVSGEIVQLASYVGGFSARAAQIARNINRNEAQWRAANPGAEPGPRLRASWDRRASAQARPDKVVPTDGADLVARWNQELHELGYREPAQPALPILTGVTGPRVGSLDRDAIAARVVSRLGAKRSAWNAADIRGEVEKQVAATGLVADAGVRLELAEDLTARAVAAGTRLVTGDVPEHVRSLTSPEVVAVEAEILTRLTARADPPPTQPPTRPATLPAPAAVAVSAGRDEQDLDVAEDVAQDAAPVVARDVAQGRAVAVLAGDAALVVVEGAAGAGKTTTLAAAKALLAGQGHRLVVVTPTLKAAQVAAVEVGSDAFSAAWLAVQHGWRWDDDGVWSREPSVPDAAAVLGRGDLLLVDEAGMLDQDTARALLAIADEAGARVAFVGDRHQLPAVGRGGVLDLAATWTRPVTRVELDVVHRFTDPSYAEVSLAMRTGREPGAVFDTLLARGLIVLHASEAERTHAIAERAAAAILAGHDTNTSRGLVLADARDQVTALNGAIRDRLVAAGYVDDTRALVTDGGERLGVGDRVATRRNDRDLGVANRQTWTVAAVGSDGALDLAAPGGQIRSVPVGYAREHVELGYAITVYGAQGQTTTTADFVLADHTGAAAAYVAMTRGRDANTAHLVGDSTVEARAAWELAFARDRADLGPAHARQLALDDIDRYGTQPHHQPPSQPPAQMGAHLQAVPSQPAGRRLEDVLADLRTAWTERADLTDRHQHLTDARERLEQVAAIRANYGPRLTQLRQQQQAADDRSHQARTHAETLEDVVARERAQLREDLTSRWQENLPLLREAAATIRGGTGVLGQRHHQVRDAREALITWADQWRTVIPDLPQDADQLTDQLVGQLAGAVDTGQLWLTNPKVREALDAYLDRQITRAHPDTEQIRGHAVAAEQQALQAENQRRALEDHLYHLLRPFGSYGLLEHADALLAETRQDLARGEDQQRTLTARIDELTTEPVVRSLPAGDLDTLHGAWQTQRVHQQQARAEERLHTSREAERARLARATDLNRRRPSPGRDIGGIGR